MKRSVLLKLLYFLFITASVTIIFSVCSSAKEILTTDNISGEAIDGADDDYNSFVSSLPNEISDHMPDSITDDAEASANSARHVSDFSYIMNATLKYFNIGLSDAVRLFVILMGLIVLSAIFHSFRYSFFSSGVSDVLSFCSSAIIISSILPQQIDLIERTVDYINSLSTTANLALPVTAALYAMGGNLTAATINSSTLMLFFNFIENICAKTIFPFTCICLTLAIAGAFAPRLNLNSISGAIKKTYTSFISFIMTIFTAVLGMQSSLAAASDGLAAKTAKFASSTFIPVVGGSVGDALRTVGGSIRLLRNNIGIFGIVGIIIMILPIVMSLMLTRTVLLLCASAADMLGCTLEKSFLSELSSIYGHLTAIVSVCSTVIIFVFALLAGTSTAIVA